ncbi:MAG: transcriptional regulator PpsR [Pseudohongiellaceae bacterium]
MKQFTTPTDSFGNLSAEGAAAIITAATDIALVIDAEGVIRDLSFSDEEMPKTPYQEWLNKPWSEAVTIESRPKVESLLKEAAANTSPRWRHINHPTSGEADLPVMYAAVPLDSDGRVLAIGRSAVMMADMQQRLLQAQQSMERNYLEIRHLETRYRLLFQVSSEAVFIVDANSLKVLEANPAAEQLLGKEPANKTGKKITDLFATGSTKVVDALLVEARSTGQRTQARATLAGEESSCLLSAALFTQDKDSLFLVSASHSQEQAVATVKDTMHARILKLVETAPDGFVLTDTNGIIISTNRAFIELTQTGSENRVRGESLDRWFGRSGVDLNVLTGNLSRHGSVRLFATTLRSEYGSKVDVEISATRLVLDEADICLGFIIRDVGVRLDNSTRKQSRLSRPVEQLTELVGRLPLRELVQESTNMVERYCIEAALEITGENRTSAAEILGLSRQSLYVKLRRYGLGDSDPESSS